MVKLTPMTEAQAAEVFTNHVENLVDVYRESLAADARGDAFAAAALVARFVKDAGIRMENVPYLLGHAARLLHEARS